MGFRWPQPDEGKWTVDTAVGRSVAGYVFANSRARRFVKSTDIWEAECVRARPLCSIAKKSAGKPAGELLKVVSSIRGGRGEEARMPRGSVA